MNANKMFAEFNAQYMVGHSEPTREELHKAACLMLDEVKEVFQELFNDVQIVMAHGTPKANINVKAVGKEMSDTRYITGERMTMFGFDVDAIDAEVHRSNMSKVVPLNYKIEALDLAKQRYPDAIVKYNDNDQVVLYSPMQKKVIKPENFYSPAKITDQMIG